MPGSVHVQEQIATITVLAKVQAPAAQYMPWARGQNACGGVFFDLVTQEGV